MTGRAIWRRRSLITLFVAIFPLLLVLVTCWISCSGMRAYEHYGRPSAACPRTEYQAVR